MLHNMKRLLDALSWLIGTWKISNGIKKETTVDALVDMYNPTIASARASADGVYYIFCVRLLRCPFYSIGQFQGLNKRDGQQVQALTLLFL